MRVLTSGGRQTPAYGCKSCFRVRRKVASVDDVVEAVVIGRLSMPDGPDLLAGDPVGLREAQDDAAAARARLDLAADQYADGEITGDQLRRITARLRPRLEEAEVRVRAAQPSPELAEFAGSGVAEAWDRASLETKRAIINALMAVTILPAGPGKDFDPETVKIEWKVKA